MITCELERFGWFSLDGCTCHSIRFSDSDFLPAFLDSGLGKFPVLIQQGRNWLLASSVASNLIGSAAPRSTNIVARKRYTKLTPDLVFQIRAMVGCGVYPILSRKRPGPQGSALCHSSG
jgi:hypothetical protein